QPIRLGPVPYVHRLHVAVELRLWTDRRGPGPGRTGSAAASATASGASASATAASTPATATAASAHTGPAGARRARVPGQGPARTAGSPALRRQRQQRPDLRADHGAPPHPDGEE